MKLKTGFLVIAILLLASNANAGLFGYGICQTGCNALAVSCYSAAGYTFGTVTAGAAVPAAIAGCNTSLGTCMSSCVVAGLSPIP